MPNFEGPCVQVHTGLFALASEHWVHHDLVIKVSTNRMWYNCMKLHSIVFLFILIVSVSNRLYEIIGWKGGC